MGRKKQKKEKKYFSNNRVRRAACFDRLTRPDRLFELALYVAPYVNCVRSFVQKDTCTWMRLVKTPVDDGLTHGEESKLNRIECKSYEDISPSWLLPREEKIWFGTRVYIGMNFLGKVFLLPFLKEEFIFRRDWKEGIMQMGSSGSSFLNEARGSTRGMV